MTRLSRILLVSTAAVLGAGVGLPPAAAVDAAPEFAVHVRHHAVEGMLGADCNPGMHQGLAGWAGHEECAH